MSRPVGVSPGGLLLRRIAFASTMLVVLAVFLLPVVWMFGVSLMPAGEYATDVPHLLPSHVTFEHYAAIWEGGAARAIVNSVIVAAGSTLMAIAFGASAAYALARYRFPASLDILFLLMVLVLKLMPPIVIALPLYQALSAIGLLNNHFGLMVANQAHMLPFAIWMLLSYFRDIPVEIEEAAALDGAPPMTRLLTIILPMARPGLFTASVFVTLMAWNEYLFVLLFIQSQHLFTLPIFISSMLTDNEILWGQLMAVGVISSLPVIIGASFFQKNLVRGFASIEK